MEEITLKELFEKYEDCSVKNYESYLVKEMMIDVAEGRLLKELKVFITLINKGNLDPDGFLRSYCGTQFWLYIPEKTYSVHNTDDYYIMGYVYKK